MSSVLLTFGWLINCLRGKESFSYLRVGWMNFLLGMFVFFAMVMMASPYVPIGKQFYNLLQYAILQWLPIIVMMSVVKSKYDVNLLVKIFLISTAICTVYSIVCFVLRIPYPYNAFLNMTFPSRNDAEMVFAEIAGGSETGRCMGTATSGTWDYGMVISMLFTITAVVHNFVKSKWTLLLLVLVGIDVLFTSRRSPIIAIGLFCLIFYGRSILRNSKSLLIGILTVLVLVFVIENVDFFKNYRHILESSMFFWDDSVAARNDVSGSSFEYRLAQLNFVIRKLEVSPLLGCGIGCMGLVPGGSFMNGWESMVFTILIQYGFVGAILWSVLFFKFFQYANTQYTNRLALAFMVSALFFAVLNDTIYPFYIFFGAVLIGKIARLGIGKYSLCEN